MSSLFPALTAIGSLSSAGLKVDTETKPKSRSIRSTSFHSEVSEDAHKLLKRAYKQSQCFKSELENLGKSSASSFYTLTSKNQPKETIKSTDEFSAGSKSCVSVLWKKRTADENQKWWGEWGLLWVVSHEDNKEDIFFNRVFTQDKKLYSEGISYKFEKETEGWKLKEKIQSGKRPVTKENKKYLIIKPENNLVRNMQGEYGGFGDFDLDNICSAKNGKNCNKLNNREQGKKDWTFVSSSSGSSLLSWSNYSEWRDPEKGLFPLNLIGSNYFLRYYTSRLPRSTELITPPTNSKERYSKLKGFFKLRRGNVSYRGSNFREDQECSEQDDKPESCSKKGKKKAKRKS